MVSNVHSKKVFDARKMPCSWKSALVSVSTEHLWYLQTYPCLVSVATTVHEKKWEHTHRQITITLLRMCNQGYVVYLMQVVGNFTVPVGHQLCVSPTVNGRLEEVWEQPQEFFPDRYFLPLFSMWIHVYTCTCVFLYYT